MEEKNTVTPGDIEMDINADAEVRGTTHLSNEGAEDDINEKLQSEIQEQKDKYLRLLAEFENYKRRTAKERIELMQTAGKDVIVSLLDVLDDADRADRQMQTSADVNLLKEGVQLVFNKLRKTLETRGVKPMESIHTPFDVEKHEAITELPAASPEQVGQVLDEVVKGYYLNEKLIRFAKVVVGK